LPASRGACEHDGIVAQRTETKVQKVLLLSIIAAFIYVPAAAARDPSPRRAMKKAIAGMSAAVAGYMLALRYVYHLLF
jgi:hypothetical protein